MIVNINGKTYHSSQGRHKYQDSDVIDGVFMMERSMNTNGRNIEVLKRAVDDLINVVNKQQLRINKLESKNDK